MQQISFDPSAPTLPGAYARYQELISALSAHPGRRSTAQKKKQLRLLAEYIIGAENSTEIRKDRASDEIMKAAFDATKCGTEESPREYEVPKLAPGDPLRPESYVWLKRELGREFARFNTVQNNS